MRHHNREKRIITPKDQAWSDFFDFVGFLALVAGALVFAHYLRA